MRKFWFTVLLFSLSILIGLNKQSYAQSQSQKKPNIVFILVDDLGYSDVGYMHQKEGIKTPNIDALAKNGMIFTNAYAAAPVCSPTRASLMTGKSPAALKITCHIPGVSMKAYMDKQNKDKKLKEAIFLDHLPLDEVTIAEALKIHGYATGFFGKWHLSGEESVKTTDGIVNAAWDPDQQGFDVNIGGCAYGEPKSYFSPYKNGNILDIKNGEYLTDRLGDEAVNFIAKNKEKPFFLYLSTYAVHTPIQAPADLTTKYTGNKYFAMIDKLDQNIGKVIQKLKDLNLQENTMVVFYSDNGGEWQNPPLRDNKGSLYEGGIRVPMIVYWPKHINAGTTTEVPVTSVDFFPTILELAKGNPAKYSNLEGQSLMPLLTENGKFTNRAIYWHFPHHRNNTSLSMASAIREGNWKLIKEFETNKLFLFNLKTDIGETNNLQSSYPKKANELLLKLQKWQKKVNAVMPQPNTVN